MAVAAEAEADLRELLAVPPTTRCCSCRAAPRAQFAAMPMNLAAAESTVDYVNTGAWSKKAIGEAKRYCKVNVAADEAASSYTHRAGAERAASSPPDAAYVHYTPNETIGGVEFPYVPADRRRAAGRGHVLDDPVAAHRCRALRADLRGAQKNIGPSGLRVVIVREDCSARRAPARRRCWDYKAMADEGSMLNTPPTFAWYCRRAGVQMAQGAGRPRGDGRAQSRQGRAAVRAPSMRRGFYAIRWRKNCRSWMNVPFTLAGAELDKTFLAEAQRRGPHQSRRPSLGRRHAREHLQRHAARRACRR